MSARCPHVIWRFAVASAAGLAAIPARGDDRAARVLDAVRTAYRTHAVDELITVEVRGQGMMADTSEGQIRLRPGEGGAGDPPQPEGGSAPGPGDQDAILRLDLTVGPVRTLATDSGVTVIHATDPERYVGRAIESLTLAELERVIPSIPFPQIALALGDSSGDTLHLPSILPPIRLHEIARGQATITLSGHDGPVAVTLLVARETHRVQRFEATVPAASGWYDLVVTVSEPHDPVAGAPSALPPLVAPDTEGRTRVPRVADLRPRGLVMVPGADLDWLPVCPSAAIDPRNGVGHDEMALGQLLDERGPMAVAFLALPGAEPGAAEGSLAPLDPGWADQVRQTGARLDAARGSRWSLVLVFDPSGRRSINAERIGAALTAAGVDVPWAWVDGRTIALERALPRIDPALAAISRDGEVLAIGQIPAEGDGRSDLATRVHAALAGAP
jgi:hypothetical protein